MKTREEHIATAMLLGMEYREHFHAYRKNATHPFGDEYYDADTGELLTAVEVLQRVNRTLGVLEGK